MTTTVSGSSFTSHNGSSAENSGQYNICVKFKISRNKTLDDTV